MTLYKKYKKIRELRLLKEKELQLAYYKWAIIAPLFVTTIRLATKILLIDKVDIDIHKVINYRLIPRFLDTLEQKYNFTLEELKRIKTHMHVTYVD